MPIEKIMREDLYYTDKRVVEEIISSAINIASGGRVESIKQLAPDKIMTSEQVQQLHMKKEYY